jgi:hypothetical protein
MEKQEKRYVKKCNLFYCNSVGTSYIITMIAESYRPTNCRRSYRMTKQELITAWENVSLIKIFEMPVMNKETGEKDWIVWDIFNDETGLIATPSDSDLSTETVEWDEYFSLDAHLEFIHENCCMAICESDKWKHSEEE